MWNLSTYDCECNKACKVVNCLCKNHLFGNFILACEDEILNTTETSVVDKKLSCGSNIGNDILVIIICHF